MKSYKIATTLLLTASLLVSSCVKDLDVTPNDPNVFIGETLKNNALGTLAKCYSSLAVPGQNGVTSNDGDIFGLNTGFGVYTRALWNMQELPTDEAKCAWGDTGIPGLNTQGWDANNIFINAMYARILYTVTVCNQFIRESANSSDPKINQYVAEARFIRALVYYHALDLFGNPTFTTEADVPGNGVFFPKQTTRTALFSYIENELKAIDSNLLDPEVGFGPNYGHANKAANWMLLARLYLNAKVYVGVDRSADCVTYSTKVINAGYTLPDNYRWTFSADNHLSTEMIFAITYDGIYTRSYGGTTFIIDAATTTVKGNDSYRADAGVVSSGAWGGNRATKNWMGNLVDTTIYTPASSFGPTATKIDSFFTGMPDSRVLMFKEVLDPKDPKKTRDLNMTLMGVYTKGVGVRKFTNVNHDGTTAANYSGDFASTDFPIFRLADAYLMRAEGLLRSGGDANLALSDVNVVRTRAFKGTSHNATAGQLNLDFILAERARELYWECVRRTDLIRYGKFTGGSYLWQWKGGRVNGMATDSHYDLFPIPSTELGSNMNLKQNPGY